jgi:hypothetical protein
MPPGSAISVNNALNPVAPVSIRDRATTTPSSSTNATSWCAAAQSTPHVNFM